MEIARQELRTSARRRALAALGLLASAAFLPACRTTTHESPAGASDMSAARATLVQSWELRSPAELLGYVLRYASEEAPPRTFFLVQNKERQDLGLVDAFGRAWRYRPHERESEWITTGTVLQGARAILEAGPEAQLVERAPGEDERSRN